MESVLRLLWSTSNCDNHTNTVLYRVSRQAVSFNTSDHHRNKKQKQNKTVGISCRSHCSEGHIISKDHVWACVHMNVTAYMLWQQSQQHENKPLHKSMRYTVTLSHRDETIFCKPTCLIYSTAMPDQHNRETSILYFGFKGKVWIISLTLYCMLETWTPCHHKLQDQHSQSQFFHLQQSSSSLVKIVTSQAYFWYFNTHIKSATMLIQKSL